VVEDDEEEGGVRVYAREGWRRGGGSYLTSGAPRTRGRGGGEQEPSLFALAREGDGGAARLCGEREREREREREMRP
jgi:hypothetical protein